MNLKVFEKNGWEVKTVVDENGEPWFALSDVCKTLSLTSPNKVKARLNQDGCIMVDSTGWRKIPGVEISKLGNTMQTFINELNLYKCILRSNKKEAELFQDWICGEVLPSIRKYGGYLIQREDESAEALIKRALDVANAMLEKKNEELRKAKIENAEISEKNRILNCDNKLLKYNVDIQKDIVEESVSTRDRFYDFFNTSETYTTTQIGKLLGRSAIWVNKLLRDNLLVKKIGNQYVPNLELVRAGYAKQVATRTYKGGIPNTFFNYRWTAKGLAFIKQLYVKHECNVPDALFSEIPAGKLDIDLTKEEVEKFISNGFMGRRNER